MIWQVGACRRQELRRYDQRNHHSQNCCCTSGYFFATPTPTSRTCSRRRRKSSPSTASNRLVTRREGGKMRAPVNSARHADTWCQWDRQPLRTRAQWCFRVKAITPPVPCRVAKRTHRTNFQRTFYPRVDRPLYNHTMTLRHELFILLCVWHDVFIWRLLAAALVLRLPTCAHRLTSVLSSIAVVPV